MFPPQMKDQISSGSSASSPYGLQSNGAPQSSPGAPMDPGSWDDEWDEWDESNCPEPSSHSSANIQAESRLIRTSQIQENQSSSDAPIYPSHTQRSSSGWLQDVFEGVRITAVQSGQEILQASSMLTSEIIQKALPKARFPGIQQQQPEAVSSHDNLATSSDFQGLPELPLRSSQSNSVTDVSDVAIDPNAWNDEWVSEANLTENFDVAVRSSDSADVLISERHDRESSSWLQDVFQGVQITGAPPQTIQAGNALTSEKIDAAPLSQISEIHSPDAVMSPYEERLSPLSLEPRFRLNDRSPSSAIENDRVRPNPVLTIDPTSWNEDWEDEEDDAKSATSFRENRERNASVDERQRGTGWFQDVLQGVRDSAVQSGQEILQASGVLTSGVLKKAKDFTPFRDQSERSVVSYSPSQSPNTLNAMSSHAPVASASLELSSSESLSTQFARNFERDSDGEVSEFLWNFPELPSYEVFDSTSNFDELFNLYGGPEDFEEFERISLDSTIRLERMKSGLDLSICSMIERVRDEVLCGDDKADINSTLVFNMERLGEEIFEYHLQFLQDNVKLEGEKSIFGMLDHLQTISTRVLAILTARSIRLLLKSIKQWAADSGQVMKFSRVLRRFFFRFCTKANSILLSSIEFAQKSCSEFRECDEDIALLHADIEVDVYQARAKIEDAISSVIPMLQCILLP